MGGAGANNVTRNPAVVASPWLLVAVAGLLAWWSWKQGAYFGVVFLPGLIGICGLLFVMFAFAPFPGRLSRTTAVALGSLVLLAAWTALSALWSPLPFRGPEYALRVISYAALFLLGIWAVLLLRDRMPMALAPVGVAMALVGVATVATLWQGSDYSWYLHPDGTLRFPIGYRNANATMFLIAAWPLLSIASLDRWHWLVRSGAIASVTVLASLALLSQSRGSLPALVVGALVFVLVFPRSPRALAAALLACAPVAIALPSLTDVYRHGSDAPSVGPLLESAAGAIAIAAALALVLAAAAFALVEPRISLSDRTSRRLSMGTGIATAVAVLAIGVALTAERGGPIEFIESRVDEFSAPASAPDFTDRGVRFGANVQSNRADFWRVALASARDRPLVGHGAGSFEVEYLRERDSHESPQDPHSAPLLMLSELGVVGAALFLAFLAAATLAALRARSLGVRAALLTAAALAATAQWFTHAAFDWFWQYPGVTAPVMFLLGAAAAPRILDPLAPSRRSWRIAGAVVAIAVALAAIPLFISERYSNRGATAATLNSAQALEDYDRAATLSPLDPRPLTAAAEIAIAQEDADLGRQLLDDALRRAPDDYRAQFLLTRLLVVERSPEAPAALRRARELNPTDPALTGLARAIREGSPGTGGE